MSSKSVVKLIERICRERKRKSSESVSITVYTSGEFKHEAETIGEYEIANKDEDSTVSRLIDNCKTIAISLNHLVEKESYIRYKSIQRASSLIIRPEDINHITLACFNEFSFYTHERPLSTEQFGNVISELEKIGKQCLDNFHLLFSSFPVEFNGEVINYSIHLQCGISPRITVYAKSYASRIDLKYSDLKLYSMEHSFLYLMSVFNRGKLSGIKGNAVILMNNNNACIIRNSVLVEVSNKPYIISITNRKNILNTINDFPQKAVGEEDDVRQVIREVESKVDLNKEIKTKFISSTSEHNISIAHNPFIFCETLGGIEFMFSFASCLEHRTRRNLLLFEGDLMHKLNGDDTEFIPEQIIQMVSSHGMIPCPHSFIGKEIFLIDPFVPGIYSIKKTSSETLMHLYKRATSADVGAFAKTMPDYAKERIHAEEHVLTILGLRFGQSNLNIVKICDRRPLDIFPASFLEKNLHVLNNIINLFYKNENIVIPTTFNELTDLNFEVDEKIRLLLLDAFYRDTDILTVSNKQLRQTQ